MYLIVQFGLSLHLNLIHFGEGLSQDRQDDIQQEERANDNEHDRKEDGHPSDARVLQIVHDLRPALQRDHLEHSDEPNCEVVKRAKTIVDKLIVLDGINFNAEVGVRWRMAESVRRALEIAAGVVTAKA